MLRCQLKHISQIVSAEPASAASVASGAPFTGRGHAGGRVKEPNKGKSQKAALHAARIPAPCAKAGNGIRLCARAYAIGGIKHFAPGGPEGMEPSVLAYWAALSGVQGLAWDGPL